jgi:hypothetical protein
MPVTPDSSAVSAAQSSLASGTPFTFTQTATQGAYAIVAIFGEVGTAVTLTDTATVTFGGQTMTSPVGGSLYGNNTAAEGFIWVWVLPSVAVGGSNTISVEFSSGNTFTGYAASFTYLGVGSAGAPVSAFGSSVSPTLAVPSAAGNLVWGAINSFGSTYSVPSFTERQESFGTNPAFIAGDAPGAPSVTISATSSVSTVWAVIGLNLIAAAPGLVNNRIPPTGGYGRRPLPWAVKHRPTTPLILSHTPPPPDPISTYTPTTPSGKNTGPMAQRHAWHRPLEGLNNFAPSAIGSLTAKGSLTATAQPVVAARLSVLGVLTAKASAVVPAALSAHGVLTAAAAVKVAAVLAAQGTLSCAAQIVYPSAYTPTIPTGRFTGPQAQRHAWHRPVAGVNSFALSFSVSALLTAHGVLSAAAQPQVVGHLNAHGQLSATPAPTVAGQFTAHGSLTCTAQVAVKAALNAHGVLSATVAAKIPAQLSSHGQLSGTVATNVTGVLSSHGQLSCTAQFPPQLAAYMPTLPSGKFTGPQALRYLWHRPVAGLQTVGTITASATFTVHGALAAAAQPAVTAPLNAHGALTCTAAVRVSGQLSVHGLLTAQAHLTATGNLSAHGSLTATVKVSVKGTLTTIAQLTGTIKTRVTAALSARGVLTSTASIAGVKVMVFLVDGTNTLIDWADGGEIAFPDNPLIPTTLPALIDTTLCTLQQISYPASAVPMGTSVQQGVTALTAAIHNLQSGQQFILAGYSQGAAVISLVLNEILSGSLTAYQSQFLGGVTFGNICRQPGKVAPVQTDPGGQGAWSSNLLTATPSKWWDFAMALDAATTVPYLTTFGADLNSAFDLFMGRFTGGNLITFLLMNLDGSIVIDAAALEDLIIFGCVLVGVPGVTNPPGLVSLGPHGTYYNTNPPGTTPVVVGGVIQNTCAWYAANYINALAAT